MSLRSPSFLLFFAFICVVPYSLSDAATSRPRALVARVTRDSSTLQYVTQIEQKSQLQAKRLVLDIMGDFLWLQCRDGSCRSSTFHPAAATRRFAPRQVQSLAANVMRLRSLVATTTPVASSPRTPSHEPKQAVIWGKTWCLSLPLTTIIQGPKSQSPFSSSLALRPFYWKDSPRESPVWQD